MRATERSTLVGMGIVLGVLLLGFGFGDKTPTPYPFPEINHFPSIPQHPDNPVSIEGAELGRHLFYDPILSLDSSISCASCHKQASAFADGGVKFNSGMARTLLHRNSPPLFNLAFYESLFWDGRTPNVEAQVFHPVRAHDEMALDWKTAEVRVGRSSRYRDLWRAAFGQQPVDSVHIAKAIAQFERTLLSYRSPYDAVLRGESYLGPKAYAGFVLANDQTKGNCLHCHTTDADPLGTTGVLSNNGLDPALQASDYADLGAGEHLNDTLRAGWFKIPSLRNVAVTAPYMHDGRFGSLEEVLHFYSEGIHPSYNLDPKIHVNLGQSLSPEEQDQIIAFLLTLTDSAFIEDPAFGSPF